jgi:Tol biopolymer transport system component
MRADGSNMRELAAGGFSSNGVEWSPDGRWIVVTNLDFRLVLMDPTTGSRGSVLTPTSVAYLADFSPDGNEIAYAVESGRGVDIYVSNIDGSNARSLTSSDTVSRYHSGPRWSPDGKLITYWSFVTDTVTRRSVPAVFLISRDGARIDWKDRATIYGDQAFWRRTP